MKKSILLITLSALSAPFQLNGDAQASETGSRTQSQQTPSPSESSQQTAVSLREALDILEREHQEKLEQRRQEEECAFDELDDIDRFLREFDEEIEKNPLTAADFLYEYVKVITTQATDAVSDHLQAYRGIYTTAGGLIITGVGLFMAATD